MNLYLFDDNNGAANYGIGIYLNELTLALEGAGIRVHIVHLHSDRMEFEIVNTNEIENWYIPNVRHDSSFSDGILIF